MFQRWLTHPLTLDLDIDDPQTTHLRQQIIQEKSFLRQVYQEWYMAVTAILPEGPEPVLELGSGAGFLRDFISDLITSEVFFCPNVRAVLDGTQLPFVKNSLRGIVMTDVLHHLPQPRRFFLEAARCVRPEGGLVMIEPWVTRWSCLIYKHLHHEPFVPTAKAWEFPASGPLSGANGALPWIIFTRDRAQFEQEFPEWKIQLITPHMPFRYLISGGISMRSLMPGWTFKFWRWLENMLYPWMETWAMFSLIVLTRVDTPTTTDRSDNK